MHVLTVTSQEGFHKALALVGAEFKDRLDFYMKAWLPAREIVQQAVQSRYQVINISAVLRVSHLQSNSQTHLIQFRAKAFREVTLSALLFKGSWFEYGVWWVIPVLCRWIRAESCCCWLRAAVPGKSICLRWRRS